MELVIGFDPVRKARPDWRSYFTILHNGKINILHAPKPILTDLLGLSPDQADAWIKLRNGKDGIESSGDEPKVPTAAKAADLIGAKGAQRALILEACDVAGGVRRIESTGFCHGVTHLITVIVSGESTEVPIEGATMLGWSEQ
jgi:hypothetical protein